MVEVPLSVDEINPETLSYCPSVVPVTETSKVQEAPAVRDPPVRAIVREAAVVVSVPPHCAADESVMERSSGSTSVKLMPDIFSLPAAVLLIVKRSTEVAPFTIGSDWNAFVMVGAGVGIPQPVMRILSSCIAAFVFVAPTALIRK